MDVEIEQLVEPADLKTCAVFMSESPPWSTFGVSAEQCEADLALPDIAVHAAVAANGTIQGFLASMTHGIGLEPLIEYLCVAEPYRNQGIGTALIEHFENVLFPDADNLYLFVSDINPNASRLYTRLGYLQVGALPNYVREAQTEFLHRKTRRPRHA